MRQSQHRRTGHSWWPKGRDIGSGRVGQEAPSLGAHSKVCTPVGMGHSTAASCGSLRVVLMSGWTEPRVSSESQDSTSWPLGSLVLDSLKSQDLWALTQVLASTCLVFQNSLVDKKQSLSPKWYVLNDLNPQETAHLPVALSPFRKLFHSSKSTKISCQDPKEKECMCEAGGSLSVSLPWVHWAYGVAGCYSVS